MDEEVATFQAQMSTAVIDRRFVSLITLSDGSMRFYDEWAPSSVCGQHNLMSENFTSLRAAFKSCRVIKELVSWPKNCLYSTFQSLGS